MHKKKTFINTYRGESEEQNKNLVCWHWTSQHPEEHQQAVPDHNRDGRHHFHSSHPAPWPQSPMHHAHERSWQCMVSQHESPCWCWCCSSHASHLHAHNDLKVLIISNANWTRSLNLLSYDMGTARFCTKNGCNPYHSRIPHSPDSGSEKSGVNWGVAIPKMWKIA